MHRKKLLKLSASFWDIFLLFTMMYKGFRTPTSDTIIGYKIVNLKALSKYNASRNSDIVIGMPSNTSPGIENLEPSCLHVNSFVLTRIT